MVTLLTKNFAFESKSVSCRSQNSKAPNPGQKRILFTEVKKKTKKFIFLQKLNKILENSIFFQEIYENALYFTRISYLYHHHILCFFEQEELFIVLHTVYDSYFAFLTQSHMMVCRYVYYVCIHCRGILRWSTLTNHCFHVSSQTI